MVTAKNQRILMRKLKKQIGMLQRKEEQSRNKLRAALQKIRKLGMLYKSKLASKIRVMKGKMTEVQSSTYGKVATDIERQIQKGIEAKAKSLRAALTKIEKKHLSKLTKGIVKKSKKTAKRKSVSIGVKKAKRSMKRVGGQRKSK